MALLLRGMPHAFVLDIYCPFIFIYHHVKRNLSEHTHDFVQVTWWTSSNGNISLLLALCARNSLVTGEFPSERPNSPHKGQRHGALMFSLIYAWTNSWANHRDAGYLRRHCSHYGVTVMSDSVCQHSASLKLCWTLWGWETHITSVNKAQTLLVTITDLNPCCIIGTWTRRNKSLWNLNRNTIIFTQRK